MRRRSRHALSALAAILVTCTGSDAGAQQARLAISGGSATDQLGTRSNAMTLAPTVSLVSTEDIGVSIGGHATRFGTSAWSFGGGVSLGARERLAGPFALTLDGSGSLARLTSATRATFGSAEILPGARVDVGRVGIFAAARVASGMVSVASRGPALPPLAPRSSSQRTTRSGMGSAVGANVLVVARPDMTLSVGGRSDRLRVGEQAIADLTLSAQLRSRALGVDASVGRRAGAERARSGTVGVSVPLGRDVALELAGGRYLSNPMLGTPSGRYMSAGLSIGLGDATPPRRAPSVRIPGVPQPPRGYTRLAIVAPDAQRVEVAGDFNEWMPARTTRAANGMWYADLRIAPGQYRYAFRIDGSEWRVPRGATAVNDGFGGTSAWLVVTVDESGD